MKLHEPTENEKSRWQKPHEKRKRAGRKPPDYRPVHLTKGGIILNDEDYKSYVDYLKKSEYKKSYKEFCIRHYLYHKSEHLNPDGNGLGRRNERL